MPDAYESLAESVIGLSLLVSNIQFWQNTGYFAKAAEEMPLLHTWSLAVEEPFYLFVPILLVLLAKFPTSRDNDDSRHCRGGEFFIECLRNKSLFVRNLLSVADSVLGVAVRGHSGAASPL